MSIESLIIEGSTMRQITSEEVKALQVGLEADCLVAEHLLGWKWYWWTAADGIHTWRRLVSPDCAPHPSYKPWTPADGDVPIATVNLDLPNYSSDWDAMEQIVIQMHAKGWEWALFSWEWALFSIEAGFVTAFRKDGGLSGEAAESGAPLAVVKAALLALVAEQEVGNG